MSFYTHFHNRGGSILLRWIDDNGRRRTTAVKEFAPTLYLKTNEETEFTTLEGSYLKPVQTESVKDAKRFIEQYSDVDGFEAYGNTNWDYSYINQRWQGDTKYDESQILVYFIDIETQVSGEFPDPNLAKEPINVISIFDGEKFHVWAFQDSKPTMKHPFPVERKVFSDEDSMLRNFLAFWSGNYPDVLTGWNTEGFDVVYLINRIRQRLGEDKMKTLSPVGYIREYNVDAKRTSFEIKGIEHLDYMQLFKKYMPGERDFSLDAVCEDFLGEQKLENPYSTFREFYEGTGDIKDPEAKGDVERASYQRWKIKQELRKRGLQIPS
jgi:DNA polymerase elongation subunit (family B)